MAVRLEGGGMTGEALCGCQVIGMVFRLFEALEEAYFRQFKKMWGLNGKQQLIHQVYSILQPVVRIIKICQAGDYPTGVEGYWELLVLRTTTLKESERLYRVDPETRAVMTEDILHPE